VSDVKRNLKEAEGKFPNRETRIASDIPSVVDRVIQQAITTQLFPIYERQFSSTSYGFRPRRSTHQARKQCQNNANEGYRFMINLDLEKFFDNVNQIKRIEVLSRTDSNGRVVLLIHNYLRAGIIADGQYEDTPTGVPQGGNISPLLY
jgi:retron-type reverse transcriptase